MATKLDFKVINSILRKWKNDDAKAGKVNLFTRLQTNQGRVPPSKRR